MGTRKTLVRHDGITEWSVCGGCRQRIDWASDSIRQNRRDDDDTSCPFCGHADTRWLDQAPPGRGASSQVTVEHQRDKALQDLDRAEHERDAALAARDRLLAALKEMVECGVSDATSAAILEARAAIAACGQGQKGRCA